MYTHVPTHRHTKYIPTYIFMYVHIYPHLWPYISTYIWYTSTCTVFDIRYWIFGTPVSTTKVPLSTWTYNIQYRSPAFNKPTWIDGDECSPHVSLLNRFIVRTVTIARACASQHYYKHYWRYVSHENRTCRVCFNPASNCINSILTAALSFCTRELTDLPMLSSLTRYRARSLTCCTWTFIPVVCPCVHVHIYTPCIV